MDSTNATSSGNETTVVAASFITEILASAGRLEKDDLNAKLGKLFRRIDEVKAEVNEAIELEYEHFLPYLHVAPDLADRVEHFHKDVSEVTEKLKTEMKAQLNSSTSEFHELSQKLSEATYMSVLLKWLMELHTLETAASKALQQGDFSTAGVKLQAMERQLEEISKNPTYGGCKIQILTALSLTCRKHLDSLENRLFESWGNHIKWNLPSQREDKQQSQSISLMVRSSEEAKASLKNTIQALHQMDLLEPKMKIFAKRVMEHIVQPIITEKKVNVLRETGSLGGPTKELSLKKRKKKGDPDLEELFTILATSVKFIYENICCIEMSEDSGEPLMTLLEKYISEDLVKLIINECLAPAIPTAKKDLEDFNVVVNTTEALQGILMKFQLITPEQKALVEYVQSVDMLFANKKCQGILTQARTLMRSDIHDTVRVTPDAPYGDLVELFPEHLQHIIQASKDEKATSNLAMAAEVKLSANTFRLPSCRISLSTQQLVKLAYEVLYEATQCDESCALQLFSTVRHMFELYSAVVPTYHKDSLTNLPQHAALYHNNCMYVAHHLLVMKHQFKTKLPEALRVGAVDFVDMVPGVRRSGTECFLKMMTSQKEQMIECLSPVNGFVSVSEENNREVADRAIRQVLHQQGRLANVWRGVLPQHVYAKSLGTLLQSFIQEVVDSVVTLEDISADDATELAALIGIVIQRAPALFTPEPEDSDDNDNNKADIEDSEDEDEKEEGKAKETDKVGLAILMKNVSKWGQLLELQLVLNAGLQEIADRWAEAKGPLAVQFSANEVKRLIRALFQNTDRRAAVMATIRQPVKN